MLDITMTACNRPEILERTLSSFHENMNLKNVKCRLVVNVDKVGTDAPLKETIEICLNYFRDTKFNFPEIPSFPKAFKWAWSQVEAPYVLHLEDDWELLRPISLHEIIELLDKYEDLALLRLPAFIATENTMKNWNKFFPWNGEFFECPKEIVGGLGFCGHPSIIKNKFVKHIAQFIDTKRNPEKQIKGRNGLLKDFLTSFRYGVYGKPNSPPIIRDLGRKWMIEKGWGKEGSKAWFVRWKKIDE